MADYNTEITVKGTTEDFSAILKVIAQFTKERNDIYFDSAEIYKGATGVTDLLCLSNEDIEKVVLSLNPEIGISASGPYGSFGLLDEVGFFERIAYAAPHSSFTGEIDGFDAGGDQTVKGVLSDGLLHLYYKYPDDGGWNDEEDDEDEWDDKTIIDLFLDEKLIDIIRANPSVTKGEMAKITKAKSCDINDTLKELQEQGRIRHEGPLRGKGGKWFVVE